MRIARPYSLVVHIWILWGYYSSHIDGTGVFNSIVSAPCCAGLPFQPPAPGEARQAVEQWLYPEAEELPQDFEMPIWDHLEELRERVLVGALAGVAAIMTCFLFSKDLVVFLEAPVASQGVRFLQVRRCFL